MGERGTGDRVMGERVMGERGMGERGMGERVMGERGNGGHILNNRLVWSCFGEKTIKPVVLCLLLYGRQDWNRSYV